MKKRLMASVTAALLAIGAFGATSASAATEFGDSCVANEATESEELATFFAFSAAGNPLSLTAPSSGIITKWKSAQAVAPFPVTQTLKVLRQNGPTTVLIVGESTGAINPGSNTFDTRIPVQGGDRLGLFGAAPLGNIFCYVPGPENSIGGFLGGGGGPGTTVPFVTITAEARFPVAAIIEPDVDGDGYGDETQDQCPQLATFHTPCPVITPDAVSAIAKKGSVTVLVTATSQAPVTVSGTVKLGKGKTATLKGGTQTVVPGIIARFVLKFTKPLRKRLKALSPKQSLRLNVTAAATDLIGRVTTDVLRVKLKGQAKPKQS